MNLLKSLLLLLCLSILFTDLNGQGVKIVNKATDFPVEGVAIFNKEKTISTITDSDGYFDPDLFPDSDTIYIRHIVFKSLALTKSQLEEMKYQVFLIPNMFLMEELDVTANMRVNPDELPYKVDMINLDEIKLSSAQTAAEILESSGNVVIQKSQGGGGSPVLRGYEANKILLVIDGVRMNNAIYRNGHLQNSITIGQSLLENVELVFGPSSIAYGSDAIGGVIHYHTKKPPLSLEENFKYTLNAGLQYATANDATTGHVDFTFGKKNFSSLTGFQYGNFGNIKIGKSRAFTSNDPDFGYTDYYVGKDALSQDVMVRNPNPELQLNTAYNQYDLLQKFLIVPGENLDVNLNFQYSTSSNISRYDQLTELENNTLQYSEWYYGPQKRLLASASAFYKNENRYFTNLKSTFAYQNIREDRINRKFQVDERLFQNEKVNVLSANFDFLKLIGINSLSYGLEFSRNGVASNAHYENIFTKQESIAQTRYPDGGSTMKSIAAYINYKWVIRDQYILTSGFRLSYYRLYSEFLNNPLLVQLPFNEIKFNNAAPTGIVGFEMYPATEWKIRTVLSTGYRSPNVDDYGKVRVKSDLITAPNDQLKPEYVYNAELGIQYQFEENISFDISGYYNLLTNAIVRTDFQLNGQDSLFYDGDMYKIITNANAAKAVVRGLSVGVDVNYSFSETKKKELFFRSTFNYNKGRNITDNVPLGHISPVFGMVKFNFVHDKLSYEFLFRYQGIKKLEDMSPYGEDNGHKGTVEGFPGWNTFNAKVVYELNNNLSLRFSIENIFNQMYRPFASGVSAPGRNFIFSFKYSIK
ncbi:MAG: TonB-dependent receptor [Bacteroidota bacterium]